MILNRREFGRTLALTSAAALTAGLPFQRLAAAASAEPDVSFVHPELRAAALQMLKMASSYKMTPEFVKMARSSSGASIMPVKPLRADIPVVEKRVAVPGGPEVLVYIVNAKPGLSRPAILHTHGGGYILGSAKSSLSDAQGWAAELDCVVVTVEYRLAPETRYTGSIEDNYAALRWVHSDAAELGVDPKRIALMGESAGGGHAALLALTARDRGEVPVLFQMLIYPMLDDRTGSSRTAPGHIGAIAWTAESNRFGWESFLGQKPGMRKVPAAAVPSRRADLAGLPPAFIGVGGIDLFVEEDIDYAHRLVSAGVPTELLVVPEAFHGFDVFAPESAIAKRFTAAKMDALKRAFAGQF
jgi:acetyl esterase/lipase